MRKRGLAAGPKDIVFFGTHGGGVRLTDDEIRNARIFDSKKNIPGSG